MPRQPKERLSAVPSQPTGDIDEEILGAIHTLDETGSNDDEDEPRPNAPPPTIPVSQAKRVGAVNAEAVASNRRRKQVLQRKLAGEKNVPWGEQDACLLYDDIIVVWPPQHLLVHVTRIAGGSRTSEYLRSQPRNGMELHDAIKQQIHGRAPEAEYQIVFRDRAGKEERGRGSVLMPSTESDVIMPPMPIPQPPPAAPAAPAAAQPLPPPPQPPPPQYPQPPSMSYQREEPPHWGPPPPRWGRPPPEDLPPRIVPPVQQQQPMQQNPDPVVVMNLQRQLSDIQAQLQGLGRVANNPMQQQLTDIQARLDALSHPPANTPPPAPPAPPPNNPMQQQLTDIQARLDALTRVPNLPPPAPAAPPPPPPVPVKMPEVPPGYAMTMINGMPCFVPLRDLSPALGAPPAAPAPAPVAQAPVPLQPLQPLPPATAAPQPMSPADHFAQTIGMVRSAVEAAQSIRNILPDQAPAPVAAVPETPEPADESPTKVVKIGDVNTIQNVADGSIRPVDTLIANLPGIVSWVDKQRNEILARQAAAQGQPVAPSGGSSIGAPTIPGR